MPIGDWIQTASGKAFYPLDPQPGSVLLDDIAHALALQCRFVGHCQAFYSVAQHSVYVSKLVPSLPALLHDAAEAYIGDVSRPLKRGLFANGLPFKYAEMLLLRAIFEQLNVKWPDAEHWEHIHRADVRMLLAEKRDLMAPAPMRWADEDVIPASWSVYPPWDWQIAKIMFLERYKELSATYASKSI